MVNGLEEENLGVFGSLLESKRSGQSDDDLNSESLRAFPCETSTFTRSD